MKKRRSWSELGLRSLTWVLALEPQRPRELWGNRVVSLGYRPLGACWGRKLRVKGQNLAGRRG